MAKKDNKTIFIAIAIVVAALIIAPNLKFTQTTINQETINQLETASEGDCTLVLDTNVVDVGDTIGGVIHDGTNTLCEIYGSDGTTWTKVGEGTTNSIGDLRYSDVITIPGLFSFRGICGSCVTNIENLQVIGVGRCTETDGGNVITVPGITTFDDLGYMDRCLATDVRMVHEYWCEGDTLHEDNFMCAEGSICFQTRSGGYCLPPDDDGYEVGDIVGSGSVSGDMQGGIGIPISLSGVDVGGDCYLGIKIWTDWGYVTPSLCQGTLGVQGVDWKFFDSSGLRWSRMDATPHADYAEICPCSWDGQTPWHIDMNQILPYPDCIIGYDLQYEIFVCEC